MISLVTIVYKIYKTITNYHLRWKLDNFKIMCERYMYLPLRLSQCGKESLIASRERRKDSSDSDVCENDGWTRVALQESRDNRVRHEFREEKETIFPQNIPYNTVRTVPSTNCSRMHSRILDGNAMSDRPPHSRFALFVCARIMHRNIRAFKA